MFSPQHNSVQSFKSCAGAKTAKLILDGIITIVPNCFVPMHQAIHIFHTGMGDKEWFQVCSPQVQSRTFHSTPVSGSETPHYEDKMTINLKIRHNSLSSVMQLLNPLYLLKQTVLFKMYVFITSKHVDSDNLCIYGFLVAIFKMLAKENDKKPKFGFSIIQLLFATNLQFLHLNVYLFTSKCILLRVINLI